jgi:uncharacterized short protein YbdD (DUF466 family)
MRDKQFMRVIYFALAGSGARIRDVVTGASGLSAYEQYLAHLRAHHPAVQPLSREAFFRSDQTARWDGVRRCC